MHHPLVLLLCCPLILLSSSHCTTLSLSHLTGWLLRRLSLHRPLVVLSLCRSLFVLHRLVVVLPLVVPPSRPLRLIVRCESPKGGVGALRQGRRGGRRGHVVAWMPRQRWQRPTTLTSAPSSRSPPIRQLMAHPALGGVSVEGWVSWFGGLCPHTLHLDATINPSFMVILCYL
jgi:hypothetical protein